MSGELRCRATSRGPSGKPGANERGSRAGTRRSANGRSTRSVIGSKARKRVNIRTPHSAPRSQACDAAPGVRAISLSRAVGDLALVNQFGIATLWYAAVEMTLLPDSSMSMTSVSRPSRIDLGCGVTSTQSASRARISRFDLVALTPIGPIPTSSARVFSILVRAEHFNANNRKFVVCTGCSQCSATHHAGSPDDQSVRFCWRTLVELCHWLRARGSCTGRRVRPCVTNSTRARSGDTAPACAATGSRAARAVALDSVASLRSVSETQIRAAMASGNSTSMPSSNSQGGRMSGTRMSTGSAISASRRTASAAEQPCADRTFHRDQIDGRAAVIASQVQVGE